MYTSHMCAHLHRHTDNNTDVHLHLVHSYSHTRHISIQYRRSIIYVMLDTLHFHFFISQASFFFVCSAQFSLPPNYPYVHPSFLTSLPSASSSFSASSNTPISQISTALDLFGLLFFLIIKHQPTDSFPPRLLHKAREGDTVGAQP